ncbi:site-specific DNA-methyltransferase [Candidatus Roizmanbacteria bacterium]|nr:MAG: site-specific DNA-methyltransferase [Candidatus Roizmanbacteria bacterium]
MQITIGDVYQLGDHRLLCGDAKASSLMKKLIRDERISLVLTDPPYGVAYVEGKTDLTKIKKHSKKIINDHTQTEEAYRLFTKEWIEVVKPYLSRKNSFYIFNSDKMLFALRDGMKDAEIKFTQLLIWIKNHSVVGRMHYLPQHELIAYGWYGSHEFYKVKDKSILCYPKPNKSPLHPTTKPVGLLRNLILNSSKIGDCIYDPFGGSGSTLIACEQTKRRCLMVEIDPEYCQVIIDRFQKVSDQKAERIKGDGK